MIQNDEDRPWKDFQGILPDEVWQQFEKIGPTAYPHQFEFINYCLSPNSAPIIGLRSLTGSGKTLCFQALLYANFKKDLQYFQMRQLKQKDGSIKDARVLFPYAIVLGQTIYLKQHEENFMKYLPDSLRGENGLTFQTFFAFGKDKGYQIEENKIEEAKANTLLCHPSKLKVAIQQRIFNASNLRYLIIDEADQLLSKDENNVARGDTLRIISFILGQTQNSNFQIIFVSATLKEKEIQELIQECVDNNFKEDKKIDKRFYDDSLGFKEVKFDLKMLPAAFTEQIAPYEITHYYIESNEPQEKTLVEILKQIFEDMQEAQVMIFFNSKVETGKIKNALLADQQMEFIVKQDYIIDCTGDTDQVKREEVRQEFLSGKKRILFCTDVLQRGLDFRKVRAIIHYSLPIDAAQQFKPESYFQRSGRTGRAKDEGVVVRCFSQYSSISKIQDIIIQSRIIYEGFKKGYEIKLIYIIKQIKKNRLKQKFQINLCVLYNQQISFIVVFT
ncbi:hypothetical protein pb186bvf_017190 [Paramecium bursaria]